MSTRVEAKGQKLGPSDHEGGIWRSPGPQAHGNPIPITGIRVRPFMSFPLRYGTVIAYRKVDFMLFPSFLDAANICYVLQ